MLYNCIILLLTFCSYHLTTALKLPQSHIQIRNEPQPQFGSIFFVWEVSYNPIRESSISLTYAIRDITCYSDKIKVDRSVGWNPLQDTRILGYPPGVSSFNWPDSCSEKNNIPAIKQVNLIFNDRPLLVEGTKMTPTQNVQAKFIIDGTTGNDPADLPPHLIYGVDGVTPIAAQYWAWMPLAK